MFNLMSNYIGSVPQKLIRRKFLVLGFVLLGTVLLVISMGNLKSDLTLESWFEEDDPTKVALDQYHYQFGSEDGVYIIYKPKDGDVFSEKSLNIVKDIRNDLLNYRSELKPGEESALDHVVRVNSLINAKVLTVDEDLLSAKSLVGDSVPSSKEALEEIRRIAMEQKNFPLQYFSKDMQYGGIYIETDFGAVLMDDTQQDQPQGEDMMVIEDMSMDSVVPVEEKTIRFKPTNQADYLKLNDAVKEILNKPEYAEHMEYYAVGNTPAAEHDAKMVEEMGVLYLAAILIMVVLLWYFFRSFSAVAWSILIVILSTIWTLGISAMFGLTISGFFILTILLILTVGIADSVHILSGYLFFRNRKVEHKTSLKSVYSNTGAALFLTAITNMVGIFALNISPVVPIQTFAIMSTIGILMAFLFTIYLLPVLIDIWRPKPRADKPKKRFSFLSKIFPDFATNIQGGLDKVLPIVEKRPYVILSTFVLVMAICIFGAFQVKIDTQILDQYPDDSSYRKSVEIADDKMLGAYNMVLYFDLGETNAFQDPKVLKAMDDLQRKFEEKYDKYVVMTTSIADVAKDAYQKLNQNREEMYIIPEDRRVLSQTLFMFNNANPVDRQRLVDDNYSKANINIYLHNYGSYQYNKVFAEMKTDVNQMLAKIKGDYSQAEATITGIFTMATRTADYLTRTEFNSFGIALVAVAIILLIVFGSLKGGLVALLPNLLPAILTVGLLGLLGIPLDFYTMMLAPIIIGISVDDTVTFISQYRYQVKIDKDVKKALKHTMQEAGQALLFTSLTLGLGFGIMAISSSAGLSNMGKFGFLAIMAGLLCDLFLIPTLILIFNLSFQDKKVKTTKQLIIEKHE